LISTNTIAQGDTREGGLRFICERGGNIYSATRRIKWPGDAAVVVSLVYIVKGISNIQPILNGLPVSRISAFLFPGTNDSSPRNLNENAGLTFEGYKIAGQGFLFSNDDDETSTIVELGEISKDTKNLERIFPYISGNEINESPTQSNSRFVIDFERMSYEETLAWPRLIELVRQKVKPYRDTISREAQRKNWWLFGESRPGLRNGVLGKQRVLVNSKTSEKFSFVFLPATWRFSQKVNVFLFETYAPFAILQSRVHECWARFFGGTQADQPVYTTTDCFETFPFPELYQDDPALTEIGSQYYEYRAQLMVSSNMGLTDIYNRFHSPDENSAEIDRLRELHASLDQIVFNSYGWLDLRPTYDFYLEYEDESDGSERKRKKPWRYRWSDDFREEVINRLLELNTKQVGLVVQTGSSNTKNIDDVRKRKVK
jgi:hypothetical protein